MWTSEIHRTRAVDTLILIFKKDGVLDQDFDYPARKLEILESWTSICDHFQARLDQLDEYLKIPNIDFQEVATTVEEIKENAARMGASLLVKACLQLQEFITARNIAGCNEAFIEISKKYSVFRDCFDILLVKEIETAPSSENLDRFLIGRLGVPPRKIPGSGINTLVNNYIVQGTLDKGFIYSEAKHAIWLSFFDDVEPKLKKFDKLLKKEVNFEVLATTIQEIKFNAARIGGKRVVEACVNVQEYIIAKDICGCREAYEKLRFEFTFFCNSLTMIMFGAKHGVV